MTKCEHARCQKQPVFNCEGQTKGRYCAKHKLKNMINVRDKPCEYVGCKIQPVYNYEGQTKGRFCAEHKLENMIDIVSR